jgi:hypothetical protein
VNPNVVYDLVGYDRKTERMAEQHPVPPSLVCTVKQFAGIGDRSDDQLGAWELTEGQVRDIAQVVKVKPDLQRCDFFLEPSAADTPRRQARGHKTGMAK